jgi:hypothetical protein
MLGMIKKFVSGGKGRKVVVGTVTTFIVLMCTLFLGLDETVAVAIAAGVLGWLIPSPGEKPDAEA